METDVNDSDFSIGQNQHELPRLISPGTLGFYNFVEVTEIVAFTGGSKTPINIFTIAVAEETSQESTVGYRFLSTGRIEIRNLKGWKFGIVRYCRPIAEFVPFFTELGSQQAWRASGNDLKIGALSALPSKVVPADGLNSVPLNRVLKNNFWNGSHVFEWEDPKKELLRPLFEDASRLQELSERVTQYIPVRIGALSDRLGNILLQLPATVITAEFQRAQDFNGLTLQIGWHAKATPRDLMVTCERNSDGYISASTSLRATGPITSIPLGSDEGHYRATIWEADSGTLLAATGEFNYVAAIPMNLNLLSGQTRTFALKDEHGQVSLQEVGIIIHQPLMVGTRYVGPNGGYSQGRIYEEEISRLLAQREFVQYAKDHADPRAERARAINDIRGLINSHCDAGVWLWDPFLSAQDILETLFFCHRSNVELRALTSGKEPPENVSAETPTEDFVTRQRRVFSEAGAKFEGLRLEFRRKYGQYGSGFHDRFLIFPPTQDRNARVWSLGTSINGVGKEHHILQKVDHGQAVVDAFKELWDKLIEPEHLIWRHP